jgi:lipid A 4'-phosphatase
VARISFGILVILGILTGAVFAIDPALDLKVASFFRDLAAGPQMRAFYPVIEALRDAGPYIIVAAIAPAVAAILIKLFWPQRQAPMSGRAALFLVLTLVLGPGLLVNGVLKENWARPRPGMVTQFGGGYNFMPWWDPRGSCDTNCSFVSGETSSAVWLAAPAMIVPPPYRYLALAAVGVYAASIATIRMLAGGHFLSDVIFAAVFTGLLIWLVHGLLFRWAATRFTEEAVDSAFARIGAGILRFLSSLLPTRSARPDKPAPPV